MIKEDYCSYEVAKILKKKGFDWECIGYYVDDEPNDIKHSLLGETNSTWESRCCSAPTLQMAMKWLREVHYLFIELKMSKNTFLWGYRVSISNGRIVCFHADNFNKYEEACESAIKYCLEYLI